MVRLIVHNAKRSVDLFKQNDPHELMRKCELRKAHRLVNPSHDIFGQPQGSSYNERDCAFTVHHEMRQMCRKTLGRIYRCDIPGIFEPDLRSHLLERSRRKGTAV